MNTVEVLLKGVREVRVVTDKTTDDVSESNSTELYSKNALFLRHLGGVSARIVCFSFLLVLRPLSC